MPIQSNLYPFHACIKQTKLVSLKLVLSFSREKRTEARQGTLTDRQKKGINLLKACFDLCGVSNVAIICTSVYSYFGALNI